MQNQVAVTAERQHKHLVILEKLRDIQDSVCYLEQLAERIDPLPPSPTKSVLDAPSPSPTLAMFLNQHSSDLMLLRDRIQRATDRIKEATF